MLSRILKENSFQLNGKNYLQTHGSAMGTKMAVAFANILMVLETQILSNSVAKPTIWKRYIDPETAFLDTVVYKGKRFRDQYILDIKTYQKGIRELTLQEQHLKRTFTNSNHVPLLEVIQKI